MRAATVVACAAFLLGVSASEAAAPPVGRAQPMVQPRQDYVAGYVPERDEAQSIRWGWLK